jgi:flavin-dependent dehydrogenase
MPERRPDLLVVGGGPAGLAVAIHGRLAGLTARVLDRGRPPVDKACGEGLMPDGVAALADLGVDPAALGGGPFRGIRYVDGETVAEADFPGGSGLGVRRTRLHAALVRRAEEVGAELDWGTLVVGLEPAPPGRPGDGWSAVTRDGERMRGGLVVGADGLGSHLRRWAGLAAAGARADAAGPLAGRRFGVRRHYHLAASDAPDRVEVWWGDRCEAYVTPVGGGEVGVAMLWSGRREGFDELLAGFPALARRLAGAPVVSRDRGAGPLRRRVRGVLANNLVLVGDAGGYLDAITGEGLSLAFHQAAALVAVAARGEPGAYPAAHRRLRRLPELLTALLLAAEARPWLRRRAVAALAADPTLFARLLALHARQLPPSRFGLTGTARLAWRLARA